MDDLFVNLLVSLLLTAVAYMVFPLIRLAINHGKFEKKRAKKIALWNSIVVGIFFCVVTIGASDGGTTWNAAPAVLYYFINRALLTEKDALEYSTPLTKPAVPVVNKTTTVAQASVAVLSHSSTNDKPVMPTKSDVYGNEFRISQHEAIQVTNSTSAPVTKPILFCRKCGNKLIENSVFCNKCGTKILTEDSKE